MPNCVSLPASYLDRDRKSGILVGVGNASLARHKEGKLLREAVLYEKLKDGATRCNVCQWRCRISAGRYGYCKTRLNVDGVLYTLVYGEVTSAAVDPIEKKPLHHFYPTSQVFSLGTWGCNFHCRHCQNWQISYAVHSSSGWAVDGQKQARGQQLSPEQSVEMASRHGCSGMAWTYNEPTVWFEYTLDGAKLARAKGLYTVYVTNGFMTPEALDLIGPYLDAYRVDVKSFSDDSCRRLTKLPRGKWRGPLETAVRAREKWGMHVEVVTNVVPGVNDSDEELSSIARWVHDSLGANTPWHVTRSHPSAEMHDFSPTPKATLERAVALGQQAGLHFIYVGNVPGMDAENTYCYQCGALTVKRTGWQVTLLGVTREGKCSRCGADLNFRGVNGAGLCH